MQLLRNAVLLVASSLRPNVPQNLRIELSKKKKKGHVNNDNKKIKSAFYEAFMSNPKWFPVLVFA